MRPARPTLPTDDDVAAVMAGDVSVAATAAAPATVEDTDALAQTINELLGDQWAVIVINDDVTTFATVIGALMRLFGHSHDEAETLAWRVHREGRAVVAVLPETEARAGVDALHRDHIQATCEPL